MNSKNSLASPIVARNLFSVVIAPITSRVPRGSLKPAMLSSRTSEARATRITIRTHRHSTKTKFGSLLLLLPLFLSPRRRGRRGLGEVPQVLPGQTREHILSSFSFLFSSFLLPLLLGKRQERAVWSSASQPRQPPAASSATAPGSHVPVWLGLLPQEAPAASPEEVASVAAARCSPRAPPPPLSALTQQALRDPSAP